MDIKPGEITDILKFVKDAMAVFDFPYSVELSTRPEKAMGDPEAWKHAEEVLARHRDVRELELEDVEDRSGPTVECLVDGAARRQCAVRSDLDGHLRTGWDRRRRDSAAAPIRPRRRASRDR